jgi:hypothetical protein
MKTRTQTPAQALASRLYSVDFALERRIRAQEQLATDDTTPRQHAVYLALTGIRTAEEKMASVTSWIRGDLERMERTITEGSTYGVRVSQQAIEFDTASALREAHLASLAALIGEDEMAAWAAARAAARQDPAEDDAGRPVAPLA